MFVLSVLTCIVSMLWLVQFITEDFDSPINQFINIWFIIMWCLLCLVYVYKRICQCKKEDPLRKKLLS